jgi:phospholipase/lecithinase/hemolysin
MGTAGAEEAAYVNAMIVANGAAHVVVVNLPDVSKTPFGYSQSADTQGLIVTMVDTFNAQLKAGLAVSASKVVLVDAAASNRDEAANPAVYGLTNTTVQACDDTKVGSSLFCTGATLIAGDVSRYEFADSVHPTPFGYKLLAQLVSEQLILKGWL